MNRWTVQFPPAIFFLALSSSLLFADAATAPAPASHSRSASNELLSADEVHKLVDAGQYKDALRAIVRILQLTGPAAAPYDRLDLLPLKAECQLQIHDSAGALQTLAQARKEAADANKPQNILLADGFAELIRKSPGDIYTPKTTADKTPIKILDRPTRHIAYDALFADQFALFQRKAAAAMSGQALPPYMEAAKAAGELRPVEFAAHYSNQQSTQAMKDLAEHALALLTASLDDLTATQARIKRSANRLITENNTVIVNGTPLLQEQTHRRGLTGQDPALLKEIIDTCGKIGAATAQLATAFGTDGEHFKAVIARSETLRLDANETLSDDYITNSAPAR